ncbi:hypothetical protein AABB24_006922 [Solanum stoloniferum]|uniref:Uncharacterized protein n=1 Tax=Solanum stoloniferum TaxID=62892 RepID=A0ABD2V4C3_9SOLN
MRRVTAEITWLIRLLTNLSVSPMLPVHVHSDSQVALDITRNPVFHERTKHIDLDYHFVRQQFLAGLISLTFVPSASQLADFFTKPLSGIPHRFALDKLGVVTLPSNLRGDIGVQANQHRNLEERMKKKKEILEKRDVSEKS